MSLCSICNLTVFGNAPIMIVDNNWISECFDRIVSDHSIAADNDADVSYINYLYISLVYTFPSQVMEP